MTNILALDTSSDACSVALYRDGDITEDFALAAREHTRRLLPMVDSLLQQHAMKVSDLDAIAFTRGPGSFTGVRISLGIVQGLAFGADIPLIPVSTLETMAAGLRRTRPEFAKMGVSVALDARMSEVYFCAYNAQGKGGEECVIAPEKLLASPDLWTQADPWIGIGPGWHYEAMAELGAKHVIQEVYPHAHDVAALALDAFNRGAVVSAEEAEPVYLRDTVSWKKREKKRSPNSHKA